MILAYLLLATGLTISSVAIYYSVAGLTAIFSAAAVPIMIMGVSLEVAKLVCATWIKQYWVQVPRLMKTYMLVAITVLMLITSLGIFGFLSKAHNDQNLVSGDVGARLAIYDEKIKTARDNIDADRKQLQQMDAAVDQVMTRSTSEQGADKSNAIRRSQAKDRAAIARDIEANQKTISQLNDEAAPVRAENRKVEAEVGPIKYLAAFVYGVAPDASMLEKAVTWIIIMIVIVFDPLAVIMLLAAQMTFGWQKKEEDAPALESLKNISTVSLDSVEIDALNKALQDSYEPAESSINTELTPEEIDSINKLAAEYAEPAEPDFTDYSEGHVADPEPKEELPEVKKPQWSGFSFPMLGHILQTKEQVNEEPVVEPNPISMDERPGDYVEQTVAELALPPANPEAAPGRNRGVMHTHLVAEPDNVTLLGKGARSSFGNEFPTNPEKGDVYLRTDYLPNRLFKFNDFKWVEVDKNQIDLYAYDELYIKHLITEIEAGRYDPDSLTDLERTQIEEYLKK